MDWVLKQEVDRDICLLYHQLAEYSYIMGDLDYGAVFRLPYWEFLDVTDINPRDSAFIRDGCLVMMLAMAWDEIDGSGKYLAPYIAACRTAINDLEPNDGHTHQLIKTVLLAFKTVETKTKETAELIELSNWVHKHYVRGYFQRKSREFETNAYFA